MQKNKTCRPTATPKAQAKAGECMGGLSVKSDLSTLHWSTKQRTFLLILAGSLEPPYSLLRTIRTPLCPLPWSDKSIKNTHLFSQVCSLLSSPLPPDSFTDPLASFPCIFTVFLSQSFTVATNWVHPYELFLFYVICDILIFFIKMRDESSMSKRLLQGTTF